MLLFAYTVASILMLALLCTGDLFVTGTFTWPAL